MNESYFSMRQFVIGTSYVAYRVGLGRFIMYRTLAFIKGALMSRRIKDSWFWHIHLLGKLGWFVNKKKREGLDWTRVYTLLQYRIDKLSDHDENLARFFKTPLHLEDQWTRNL